MSSVSVEQQLHGYKGGHHLLASSIRLSRDDQDLIDRLSDLSGPLDPGQVFDPYLTTYPLASGNYYVVARTWQDRQAQRAGCVLTRSLIFSMKDWLENPSISSALMMLEPFEKEDPKAERIDLPHDEHTIEPIFGPWVEEITEALFLEQRQPIVIFGVRDADPLLARLLISLWPGLRRQFSTCGFALGPRRIVGRLFDLLCAPATSRVRFSDWAGRKVDTGFENAPSRHRWTSAMADQIFRAPNPGLANLDTLGLLKADTKGSEGVLRVALMWNELAEKVDTSPTAALGLLDILRSQQPTISFDFIKPILSKSIQLSEQHSDTFEHLRFLLTMLGKFSEQPVPLSLLRSIYNSAKKAATSHLNEAYAFLSSTDSLGRLVPRILFGAVAAASAGRTHETLPKFILLLPQTRLRLLASDSKFASDVALGGGVARAESLQSIASALEFDDEKMRMRAAGHLLPALSHPDQAPIVSACLVNADWPSVSRDITLLWQGCRLSVSEFDQPILKSATALRALKNLRSAVALFPQSTDTDRLLTSTLRPHPDDVSWLVKTEALSNDRRARMLLNLVAKCDDDELARICKSSELRRSLLRLLQPHEGGVDQCARILIVGGIGEPGDFKQSSVLLPHVSRSELQHRLALALLRSLLFAGFSKTWTLKELSRAVSICSPYLSVTEVIVGVTDRQQDTTSFNRNIQAVNAAPEALRSQVLYDIDDLSERIITFGSSHLDHATSEAWAELISDAGPVNSRAQVRAAQLVLPLVLRTKSGPVTPLIIATFPIVHAELAERYSPPSLISMLLGDYRDRCDVLRRQLVDAFGNSEWPPADLMVTAFASDVPVAVAQLVVSRLSRKYRKAILNDASRLPTNVQESIRKVFAGLSREEA